MGIIQFFRSLETVIPCPICRNHYSKFLKESPIENHVSTRDTVIQWLFDIHNHVNEQLGKPIMTWEQFIKQITKLHNMSHLTFYEAPTSSLGLVTVALAGVFVGLAATYAFTHIIKKQ